MAKSSKPTILKNNGKTPKSPLLNVGSSASKTKSPLMPSSKKSGKKSTQDLPDQAFAIPGFGDTGLTGES